MTNSEIAGALTRLHLSMQTWDRKLFKLVKSDMLMALNEAEMRGELRGRKKQRDIDAGIAKKEFDTYSLMHAVRPMGGMAKWWDGRRMSATMIESAIKEQEIK